MEKKKVLTKKEFADKWGYTADSWGANDCTKQCLSDLNVLVETEIEARMLSKDEIEEQFPTWDNKEGSGFLNNYAQKAIDWFRSRMKGQ